MFDRPLVPILLTYLGGIITAHLLFPKQSGGIPFLCLIIGCLLILFLVMKNKARTFWLLVLFFALGSLSYLTQVRHSEIHALAEQRKQVTVEGVILQPPRVENQQARFLVRVNLLFDQGLRWDLKEDIMVTVYRFQDHFLPGDRIRFPARLRAFHNFNIRSHRTDSRGNIYSVEIFTLREGIKWGLKNSSCPRLLL